LKSTDRRPLESAFLISRDEGENLQRTVWGLLATLPRDSEVIVVDDGSTDGGADFIDASYPAVRVIRAGERLGIARARNLGGCAANGEMLVFSDAHVDVQPGWFEGLLPSLEDDGVGLVAPAIAVMGNEAAKGYGYTLSDLSLGVRWLHWQQGRPYEVPMVCGCFMAMRRSVFEAVGGFDAGFRGWGAEDSELSLRLWLLGYRCLVDPNVEVVHLFRQRFPYEVDMRTCLHNNLRLGVTHFSTALLEGMFARLAGDHAFPGALAEVIGGGALERRQELLASRRYDAEWFFDRFGIPVN
jgi:glycosyltransferase involved in cell wall biosynthesis